MVHELLWRMTYKCDKDCSFCFNKVFDDQVDYSADESGDIGKVLAFIQKHGIQKVYLSGGEPAMSPRLLPVIQQLAPYAAVTVFTNGLLLKRYTPEALAELPVSAINISTPLEDIQTGSRWFWELLSKLERIKEYNPDIRLNTQLMITDAFFSVQSHPNFQKLTERLDRVFWQPLTVPVGHPLYGSTVEGLSSQQASDILSAVENSSNPEMLAHGKYIRQVLAGDTLVTCQMGRDYITLNPDLTVSLCPHKNDQTVPMELFEETPAQPCHQLSMRCVCLYSHLKRRYP